ncbi:MAG: amino acid adenylation domain-containing protein [Acidobacteria bacterium]|nr:amino acid adenylation domain-containing protein [Acidobacteriota bacterium]
MHTDNLQGFRLSPQQRRLWLLRGHERTSGFRACCAVRVEGAFDARTLKSALSELVARHEILRTTFVRLPGMSFPLQTVAEKPDLLLREYDLSGAPEVERRARANELFKEAGRAAFDPGSGPVLQAFLLALAPTEHLLILSLPALHADAAGLRNLVRNLGVYYTSLREGGAVEDEPLQYADLSEWQNELLESEESEAGREYWRELWRRHDVAALLDVSLPFEKRPTPGAPFSPRALDLSVGAALSEKVDEVAREYGSTTETVLLACWQTLLWRLTGASEVLVGYVADQRKYDELRDALGLFAKTLPAVARFDQELRFDAVLSRLRQSVGDASGWQEYFTGEELWAAQGRPDFIPFAFEFEEGYAERFGDLTLRVLKSEVCADRFRVKLSARALGDGLSLSVRYDASVVGRLGVAALSRSLLALLSSSASEPAARASALGLHDARGLRRLVLRSRSPHAAAAAPLFQDLFASWAAAKPDAVAARREDRQVTYAELDRRSNQLARFLRRAGVGPEKVVALYLPRGIGLVVAVLGVLKAGGAYLPLDLSSPAERLRLMVEDSGAVAVLSETGHEAALDGVGLRVGLEAEWPRISRESPEAFEGGASGQNLAYVIYTSGSTGRPKGVMVEHAGLANYLAWALSVYPAGEGAGSPVHSPAAFDLTVTSLLAPLAAGSRVLLLGEGPGASPLAETLRRDGDFGLVKLTPAHVEAMEAELGAAGLAGRARSLVIGGEALRWSSLRAWREHAPATRLINEYGPTEAVVGCSTYEVGAGKVEPEGEMVPIGRAIAGSSLYVSDGQGRLAPEWVWGELWVGGRGLARGYLGAAALTAERFVPDAWAGRGGARAYRTGDVGRWGASRQLEYGGRADRQVKVRGYRVEPGEVESALSEVKWVRGAAVEATEGAGGVTQLVAYVACAEDADDGPAAQGNGAEAAGGRRIPAGAVARLREHLLGRLPEYMVPSEYVTVAGSLPLTRNGKVDREALQALAL